MVRILSPLLLLPVITSALMSLPTKEAIDLMDSAKTVTGEAVDRAAKLASSPPARDMMMNGTLMQESLLPRGSRHISGETMASDWLAEYQIEATAPATEVVQHIQQNNAMRGKLLCLLSVAGAAAILTVLSVMAG
eukprot:CAMPEP_0178430858 /NCGR_PEP_ID=MMETSP0689_2-20121128/31538_1 /TAXON_ID=160604 /ORGANISM="Amphidinium massartii, Strain CS-259" /LENGTH=134 /DNA_ID=CAMNT_0020052731 /DNA_START=80 /DNA_END=481 /DNA_ORIENTATION=-